MALQPCNGDDHATGNSLAGNFGGTGKVWHQADFNYDGKVDTLDFNFLAANFGKSLSEASGFSAVSATPSVRPQAAKAAFSTAPIAAGDPHDPLTDVIL